MAPRGKGGRRSFGRGGSSSRSKGGREGGSTKASAAKPTSTPSGEHHPNLPLSAATARLTTAKAPLGISDPESSLSHGDSSGAALTTAGCGKNDTSLPPGSATAATLSTVSIQKELSDPTSGGQDNANIPLSDAATTLITTVQMGVSDPTSGGDDATNHPLSAAATVQMVDSNLTSRSEKETDLPLEESGTALTTSSEPTPYAENKTHKTAAAFTTASLKSKESDCTSGDASNKDVAGFITESTKSAATISSTGKAVPFVALDRSGYLKQIEALIKKLTDLRKKEGNESTELSPLELKLQAIQSDRASFRESVTNESAIDATVVARLSDGLKEAKMYKCVSKSVKLGKQIQKNTDYIKFLLIDNAVKCDEIKGFEDTLTENGCIVESLNEKISASLPALTLGKADLEAVMDAQRELIAEMELKRKNDAESRDFAGSKDGP